MICRISVKNMHFPVCLISIFIHILIKRHFPLLKRVDEKICVEFRHKIEKNSQKGPGEFRRGLRKGWIKMFVMIRSPVLLYV